MEEPTSKIDHSVELHINADRSGENAIIQSVRGTSGASDSPIRVVELCPGLAVELSGDHVSGVRVYPIPVNPEMLTYGRLDEVASKDVAAITSTLAVLVEKLKQAA